MLVSGRVPHNFIRVQVKFKCLIVFCGGAEVLEIVFLLGTRFLSPIVFAMISALRHPCVVFDLATDGSGDVTLVSM